MHNLLKKLILKETSKAIDILKRKLKEANEPPPEEIPPLETPQDDLGDPGALPATDGAIVDPNLGMGAAGDIPSGDLGDPSALDMGDGSANPENPVEQEQEEEPTNEEMLEDDPVQATYDELVVLASGNNDMGEIIKAIKAFAQERFSSQDMASDSMPQIKDLFDKIKYEKTPNVLKKALDRPELLFLQMQDF